MNNALKPAAIKSSIVKFGGSWKNNWWMGGLSDPSTYPLILLVTGTFAFGGYMGWHALTTYKDVKIDPKKRNSMLQTWGQEQRPHLVKKWVGWNAYAPEGLGIDHNKWKVDHEKSYLERWTEEHMKDYSAEEDGEMGVRGHFT